MCTNRTLCVSGDSKRHRTGHICLRILNFGNFLFTVSSTKHDVKPETLSAWVLKTVNFAGSIDISTGTILLSAQQFPLTQLHIHSLCEQVRERTTERPTDICTGHALMCEVAKTARPSMENATAAPSRRLSTIVLALQPSCFDSELSPAALTF